MKSSGSSTPRLLGAALIIIAAGAAGFFVYRAKQPDPGPLTPATAPAAPVAAPAAAESATSSPKQKSVPDTLPDITLADRDGKPTKLASFGGRPLMVNFWATWCAPCRREIPLLNKIRMQRKAPECRDCGSCRRFQGRCPQIRSENAPELSPAHRGRGRFGRCGGLWDGNGFSVFRLCGQPEPHPDGQSWRVTRR